LIQEILFLLFRRMRLPLIVLICAYAISVLGFVLIPGQDDTGAVWHMSFFHAFYFVSFMGSTIGFGEIPYEFTDAQRFWALFTIYLTVISWLYGIGYLISLIQDPAFQNVMRHSRFYYEVKRIRDPFYLVCGYGDTGEHLIEEMSQRYFRSVVVDIDQSRIDHLTVTDLHLVVPGICGDASDPSVLKTAGLENPYCIGLVALTNDDQANLSASIAAKLISPKLKVISRAETLDYEANLLSFDTDHVVNPYSSFAEWLAMAIHSPSMYLIHDWMTGLYDKPLSEPLIPPKGTWIVCGYGRFGKAVIEQLQNEGVQTVLIEAEPEQTGAPRDTIIGSGTEAVTLNEAGIMDAAGIVAGTNDDANNLSIIMTARALNPGLFAVARQNRSRNTPLFQAAKLDLAMQPGAMMAQQVAALMMSPMLVQFLQLAKHQDDEWANILISRITTLTGEEHPITWKYKITAAAAPALYETIEKGGTVTVGDLLKDPTDRECLLGSVPLMISSPGEPPVMLPEDDHVLHLGDRLLFTGTTEAHNRMGWVINNFNALEYVLTGIDRPSGYIFQWLHRERTRA
jgi:Trk K+ transport system NAD-binding subunit